MRTGPHPGHVVIAQLGPSSHPCPAATRQAWVHRATRACPPPSAVLAPATRISRRWLGNRASAADWRSSLRYVHMLAAAAARTGRAKRAKLNSIFGLAPKLQKPTLCRGMPWAAMKSCLLDDSGVLPASQPAIHPARKHGEGQVEVDADVCCIRSTYSLSWGIPSHTIVTRVPFVTPDRRPAGKRRASPQHEHAHLLGACTTPGARQQPEIPVISLASGRSYR